MSTIASAFHGQETVLAVVQHPLDHDASGRTALAADDPSLRASDGGGLVTPDTPTGILTSRSRF